MRCIVVTLLLAALAPPLHADIFECADKNGAVLFTNEKFEAKNCKALALSPPGAAPNAPTQAEAAATFSVGQLSRLSAARDDPDPSTRLQLIEDWARGPQDTLDAVTHALVDPDESVRAQAQELLDDGFRR
jgi:hypothetical protein